ncbi:MAG: hypothetical protein P1V97_34105, partial [Planctomycetota bacterium]|nr:hypothetical protein [Planctomycetota bacterium]
MDKIWNAAKSSWDFVSTKASEAVDAAVEIATDVVDTVKSGWEELTSSGWKHALEVAAPYLVAAGIGILVGVGPVIAAGAYALYEAYIDKDGQVQKVLLSTDPDASMPDGLTGDGPVLPSEYQGDDDLLAEQGVNEVAPAGSNLTSDGAFNSNSQVASNGVQTPGMTNALGGVTGGMGGADDPNNPANQDPNNPANQLPGTGLDGQNPNTTGL